jgi:predicted O-linked N-acetylglucosamine transferase (SPINDLY family)
VIPTLDEAYARYVAGDAGGALGLLERLLADRPHDLDAAEFAGALALQAGDAKRAASLLADVARQRPGPQCLNNLALALKAQGRRAEYLATLRQAAALAPDQAAIRSNLGHALAAEGFALEAADAYRRAATLEPASIGHRLDLAEALAQGGRWSDAEAACRQAIAIAPANADARLGLGTALREQGDYAAAMAELEAARALAPGNPEVARALGDTCNLTGRHGQARRWYLEALAGSEPSAALSNNLATVSLEQADFGAALTSLRQVTEAYPDYPTAWHNLLFCLNYHPEVSAEALLAEYRAWARRFADPLAPASPPTVRDSSHRRIRVGYVSPDFRRHSARHFVAPLIENHDRSRFEVFLYAEVAAPDEVSEEYRRHADHWISTVGMSDEAVAGRIRDDGIDILVDLAGHTAHNRLLVFARKPAPRQLTYLGYGCTTGISAIDAFLADGHLAPRGSDALFAERVMRLPRPMYCYRPAAEMPDCGPLPAVANGFVTFGCFSRAIRYNAQVVTAWAAILRAVPGSRLVLNTLAFVDPETRRLFLDRFVAQGVAPQRIDLICTQPQTLTWASYRQIDIALDPFPHNAGTTTFEALWMGVPVLSLRDRPPLGRFGAALLEPLGLGEWLADSAADYQALAVRHAADLGALSALRAGLRQRVAQSPFRDEAGLARAIEDAYLELLEWVA